MHTKSQKAKGPTVPAHYHSHAHAANVEVTEKRFYVLETLSDGASVSNGVARTWKHIPVASTSATDSYTIPFCSTISPINPEAHEAPNHTEVPEQHQLFLPSEFSHPHRVV